MPNWTHGAGGASKGNRMAGEFGGGGVVADHVVRHATEEGEHGCEHWAVETLDDRSDSRFV